jgi:hypothetical protein
MTFEDMKRQARQLPPEELSRHAKVSINNNHKCRECFTCACVEVLEQEHSK